MSLTSLRNATADLERRIYSSDTTSLLSQVTSLWELAIQIPSMPPCVNPHPQELEAIRDFFESALRAYIKCEDINGIEQCFEILKNLYQDYSKYISDSENQWKIWGLYLIYLLSYNKIEEFHSELEAVPWSLYNTNKYIKFAIALEQFFMEGNYQEVLQAKDQSPSSEFEFFVNRISDTIRFEIAASFEKAYVKLSLEGACKLLQLKSLGELESFLKVHSEKSGKDIWRIEGNYLFVKTQEAKAHEIPRWQLISQAVGYAIELERIV
jgi:26S proteasome regulatory subunit N12